MGSFSRYQHIEKLGNDEVDGLLDGTVYLFSKLDGSNASIWVGDDGEVHLGSRNREVTKDQDNHGFYRWWDTQGYGAQEIGELLRWHTNLVLYGEWLVPHTFKGYYETSWNRFWAFDVWDSSQGRFLGYEEYVELFHIYGLDCYVPVADKLNRPSENEVREHATAASSFLVRDGAPGEGVVVKRYDFVNRYGRPTWGKVVLSEFIESKGKTRAQRAAESGETLESNIASGFLTAALVEKTAAKIADEHGTGWRTEYVGQLLGTVWHEFFVEELWNATKKLKVRGDLNIGRLNTEIIKQTKELAPELF